MIVGCECPACESVDTTSQVYQQDLIFKGLNIHVSELSQYRCNHCGYTFETNQQFDENLQKVRKIFYEKLESDLIALIELRDENKTLKAENKLLDKMREGQSKYIDFLNKQLDPQRTEPREFDMQGNVVKYGTPLEVALDEIEGLKADLAHFEPRCKELAAENEALRRELESANQEMEGR